MLINYDSQPPELLPYDLTLLFGPHGCLHALIDFPSMRLMFRISGF
jgi:hypothetical protein